MTYNKKLRFSNNGAQVSADVVKGDCPQCKNYTVLVSIYETVFRCMTCGYDLEQKVNGKISYMPIMTSQDSKNINLKSK
jgi:ribosomal protein S27E|tara:strand:- start:133 stop:369 length:237 start_codon:yes stop_codon:yes gene_type:complete